jgi:2'-5' RNA ligase
MDDRLFFALWPESDESEAFATLANSIRLRKGRMHHPDDLHMTLVFLGMVEEERLPCIYQAADSIQASAFDLRIDRLGYWPRPGIVWCGPDSAPKALYSLVGDLQQRLVDCGFTPERRSYKPHVTLYRKAYGGKSGVLESPIPWSVKSMVLAGSASNSHGQPRYRILRRWKLQ